MRTACDEAPSERFARLRAHFHALIEADPAGRAAALRVLQSEDPVFAEELALLLGALDERDLTAASVPTACERIGPFRLLRSLGRGGMGEVWLAERVEGGFEQQVALKRVHAATLSPDLVQRFLRERQILARLVHPNIAYLVDGGFDAADRPWLAMEYVNGERITHWCARHALDPAERVRLLLPICDAVQFAHRNLVVHRDLKPANIMIDAEWRPRLLDFGIARLLDPGGGDTQHSMLAMTPAYAAPEQRSGGEITTATDVYQLGVVLRELLACPDGAEAPASFQMPRALAQVIAKATRDAPGDRYAGVAAFADDLRDWLDGRALRSGIGSRRERIAGALREWRWPLALTSTLLLSLAVGAAFALREARVAQARERDARASFEALLGVIGSANPGRFAGREPLAGDLLIDAAARLRLDFAHNPSLLHEALGEIGHGLLNLGRTREAEAVLLEAHSLLRRAPAVSVRSELGLLKLLVLLQTEPAARARLRVSAARIAELAATPDAPPGIAMDALASAAASAAAIGENAAVRTLIAQAERIAAASTGITAAERESFWRQRGRVALTLMDTDAALQAFAQSRLAQDSDAAAFSALRRAELDLLMAQVALARGDAREARLALGRARPVMHAEYPEEHLERAHFDLQEARLALLEDDARRAMALAQRAHATLAMPGGEGSGRVLAEQVLRVASARNSGCGPDAPTVDDAPLPNPAPHTPLKQAERAWTLAQLRLACSTNAAPSSHAKPLANSVAVDVRQGRRANTALSTDETGGDNQRANRDEGSQR